MQKPKEKPSAEEIYEQASHLLEQGEDIESLEQARTLFLRSIENGYSYDAKLESSVGNLELREIEMLKGENKQADIANHVLSAKMHFYASLTLDATERSAHYGLYRVAVLEGDYEEAIDHLKEYDKEGYDFSLVYDLLERLYGKPILKPSTKGECLQDAEITYMPILQNYRLAKESLENHVLNRVVRHLEVCDTLARKKNIPVDFSTTLHLSRELFEKSKESQKRELRNLYAKDSHIGNRMLISQKLLGLDATDVESHFLFMDSYLDLKVYTPLIEECNLISKLPKTKEQEEMLKQYQKLLAEGKKLESLGQLEEAITHYQYGYQKLGVPYFKLCIARICAKIGDYEQAISFSKDYLQEGYFYFVQAATFLYKTYRQTGNMDMAMHVAIECYKKSRMRERGFSLSQWMNQLEMQFASPEVKGEEDSLHATYQYRISE